MGGMMRVLVSELKHKDIITLTDGRRLGFMTDIEIDLENGRTMAVIVPGPGKFFGLFGHNEDLIIPWDKIHKIGFDVILIDMGGSVISRHTKP